MKLFGPGQSRKWFMVIIMCCDKYACAYIYIYITVYIGNQCSSDVQV